MTDQRFREAVELYGDMVFRLAYSYLKNRADAEDVMQETLLKFYVEPRGFESPDHEKHWLLRVAANECKKLLRSPWRRRTDFLDEAAEAAAFDQPAQSELFQQVMSLPPKYRASDEAKKEVLVKMNEMDKKTVRRPWKALRAVAMAAVLTLALAISANAATNGELFENMRIIFQDDSRIVLENDAGARVEVTGVFADAQLEDGKLILTVDNAEFDITDEIAENGVYTGTVKTAGGEDVGVTVTGTLEDCEVQLSSQDGDTDYNVATESSASAETYTSVTTTTIED